MKLNLEKNRNLGDRKLLIAISCLLGFGLVILLSASSAISYSRSDNIFSFVKGQLLGLVVGLSLFIFFAWFDYRRLKQFGFWSLILTFILLILVYIPGLGEDQGGKARNWISIFGHSLQPTEFVKLTFLVYLASWLGTQKEKLLSVYEGLLPFIVILSGVSALVILAPDFGTLAVIICIAMTVYFLAGCRWRDIVLFGVVGIIGVTALLNVSVMRMDRVECYLNPNTSTAKECYQLNQSLIAIGSGGIVGRGLGQSRQKFAYLPEVWSDAIFAIVAEETGFIVSVILIGLYLFIFYRGIMIARNAPDEFGKLMAGGISVWIFVQAFFNMGGHMNLIPMTGVPLPFISSGGTAIAALLAALGILVNISRYGKTTR